MAAASRRRAAALGAGVVHGAALALERRRGGRRPAAGGDLLREVGDLESRRRHRRLQAVGVAGQRRHERGRRRGEVDRRRRLLPLQGAVPDQLLLLVVVVRQRRQPLNRRGAVNLGTRLLLLDLRRRWRRRDWLRRRFGLRRVRLRLRARNRAAAEARVAVAAAVDEGDELLEFVDGDVGDGPVVGGDRFLQVLVVGVGEEADKVLDTLEAGGGGFLGGILFHLGREGVAWHQFYCHFSRERKTKPSNRKIKQAE